MTEFALYSAYLSWLGHNGAVSLKHLFDFPLTTKEDYENDSKVINHIIYFVPDLTGSVPRGFFFLEEDIFAKDGFGELVLQSVSFRLFEE